MYKTTPSVYYVSMYGWVNYLIKSRQNPSVFLHHLSRPSRVCGRRGVGEVCVREGDGCMVWSHHGNNVSYLDVTV